MSDIQERERLYTVFAVLIFLSWVAMHPYGGIRHDGVLYLAQALLRRDPATYSQDLFFAYGSQDQYTVFSRFYALMIDLGGVKSAFELIILADQFLFLSVLAWLIFGLFERRLAIWSLFCVTFASPFYGGKMLISYAEPFLTARNAAEPFALLGLVLLVIGRNYWALTVFFLVAALQPLVSIPCLVIWWFFRVQGDKRYFYALLGLPALVMIAAVGVPPFDTLLTSFDPAWWHVVEQRNTFVIPLLWDHKDWALALVDVLVLTACLQWVTGRVRRIYIAVLAATVSLFFLALVSTSVFHNTLLTCLQLWRVMWITHLLAVASIPLLTSEYMRQMRSLALSWILVVGLFMMPQLSALPLVGFAGFAYLTRAHSEWQHLRVRFWCNLAASLLAAILALGFGLNVWECLYGYSLIEVTQQERVQAALYDRQTHVFVVSALAWVYFKWRRPFLALGLLGTFLLMLGLHWDQRTPWQRFLLDPDSDVRLATQFIKPGGQVYWSGDVLAPWVLLKSPSYFSFAQGSGLLFYRQTAMVFEERRRRLGLDELHCDSQFNMVTNASCQPTLHRIKTLCKAERHLDLLVFPTAVWGLKAHIWTIPLPSAEPKTFYLYPCAELR